MVQLNWGMIKSGPTFEALVSMIVFYEDPKAQLFGRPGQDGGQDVRSGDGSMVFQAKYHNDEKTSHVFNDAKSELKKILNYRTSGHARFKQWESVTHWRLVTNVNFNPTDEQKWTNEIVPLFAEEGLIADYWIYCHIDGLLAKHSEVQRMFFEGENRLFLTTFEAEERIRKQDPFAPLPDLSTFVGRQDIIEGIRNFLQGDMLFLAVHGSGGVGKSRLLVEAGQILAGEGEWQVLWGLPHSMEQSSAWFQGIVPERATLLLLDEPEKSLLQILEEQLGERLGRTTRWKAVIAVRSVKDPVLSYLRQLTKINAADLIELQPLAGQDPMNMCLARLSQGPLATQPEEWHKQAARQLAMHYKGFPVWLNLAISVLERDGDLNRIVTEEEGLVEKYLEEILGPSGTSKYETTLSLLRWIALIGPVNREDNTGLASLAEQSGIASSSKVLGIIKRLVGRCALSPFGAYDRLVMLRPDCIRDHILVRWLSKDLGYGRHPIQLSEDAQILIQKLVSAIQGGIIDRYQRRILASLSRTEILLQRAGKPLTLLDQFFTDLQQAIPAMSADQRITMVKVLADIADARPINVIEIVSFLRKHPVDTEVTFNLLGEPRKMGQDEVLLEVPWLLYLASRGALKNAYDRRRLLCEMGELILEETRIGHISPLPRDGRRASKLFRRIHSGGPDFMVSYYGEILPLTVRWLEDWLEEPSSERSEALKALIGPAIALEREQVSNEGYTINIRRSVMLQEHPGWQPRMKLLLRIRCLLQENSLSITQRCVLWKLLDDAHHNLWHAARNGDATHLPLFEKEIQGNLQWELECLKEKKEVKIKELQTARKIWDWHLRFDEDEENHNLAEQLEAIYRGNKLAAEFEPLVGYDVNDPSCRERKQQQKAERLAELSSSEDIVQFIERAVQFLGPNDIFPVLDVANHLGRLAPDKPVIGEYLAKVSSGHDDDYQLDFATCVISSWVMTLREKRKAAEASTMLRDFFFQFSNPKAQSWLLQRTYLGRGIEWAPEEYQWLLNRHQLYREVGRLGDWFKIVAENLDQDFRQFQHVCESVLQELPYKDLPLVVQGLIEGIYLAISDHQHGLDPNRFSGLAVWVLDQVALVYDLEKIYALSNHGDRLFKKLGRAPISWLADTLARRRERENAAQDDEPFYAISMSGRARLSRFIEPVYTGNSRDNEVISVIERLVDFSLAEGSFRFGFHKYLKDIDPDGLIVPNIVSRRLENLSLDCKDQEKASRLARIALEYPLGGAPWRRIAIALLHLANKLPQAKKEHLWSAIVSPMMTMWSAKVGQVPQVFIDEANNAQRLLNIEAEDLFRPFWDWYVNYTQTRLHDEEERLKEDQAE